MVMMSATNGTAGTGDGDEAFETVELPETAQANATQGDVAPMSGTAIMTPVNEYIDVQTRQLISPERIAEVECKLIEIEALMAQGRKEYKHIIKTSTKGKSAAKWDAEHASNKILGGK